MTGDELRELTDRLLERAKILGTPVELNDASLIRIALALEALVWSVATAAPEPPKDTI